MNADTVRERSLFYRYFCKIAAVLGHFYRCSLTCRALQASGAFCAKLVYGSAVVRFFKKRGSQAVRGGFCAILLSRLLALLEQILGRLSSLFNAWKGDSILLSLLGKMQRDAERSSMRALCELMLGFAAASLLVRLALGAYSLFSIAFFALAALVFLYLRRQEKDLQAALERSFFYRKLIQFLKSDSP